MLGWQSLAIDVVRTVEEVNECVPELTCFDAYIESADPGIDPCTQCIFLVDQCPHEKRLRAPAVSTTQLGTHADLGDSRRMIGT